MLYDLELDSSKLSTEECAIKIRDFIKEHPNPTAFLDLEKKY
jgi:hypothetical protein